MCMIPPKYQNPVPKYKKKQKEKTAMVVAVNDIEMSKQFE